MYFMKLGWVGGISPIDYSRVLELRGECPSWESFRGILAHIYASFGEKTRKTNVLISNFSYNLKKM